MEQEKNAVGNVTKYQYNSELLLQKMTDSAIQETEYRYDSLNRVTKYTDYKGREVRYAYDALGNMAALTYPGGEIVNYAYNADGSVSKMTSSSGGTFYTWEYAYDQYGRLIRIKRPDGTEETREYNSAGDLVKQTDRKGSTVLQENTYVYDVFGEITEKSTTNTADPEGLQTVSMEYDAANRLTKYNGQTVEYDAKGNMTTGPVDGKMQRLTYDCRNRLVEAGGVSYTYDAENTRISSTVDGRTTEYVTDTGGSMSRLLTAYEADGTETSYYYGTEGLAGQYNDGTGERLYYHFDNIGSTTLLTNQDGTVADRFVYGTYGELLSGVTKKVRFLFNGAYGVTTDDNGLYYMRARYYNPDIKRFINQDIKVGDIGSSQSLNRYAYCEGNPVSLIDPFGLSPEETQEQGEKSKYEKLHKALDLLGLAWDGADVINAFVYAAEGQWGKAAVSVACALPFIGTVVTAATKAKKFAKVGSMIGKTLQMAGKVYMTAQAAATALDMAGNARIEYAVNGGQVTLGVAANTLGAIAMGAIAAMSGKDLVSETLNLSKLDAQDISFKSSGQETADTISGKNTQCDGISGCFTAGTKIKTADGEKNVEEVNTGDYVLAEDPETGEQEYKRVVHTFIHVKWQLVHVTIDDEEIETTTEHPFYVEGVGFVSAKNLQPGDIIRTSDGRNLPIQKVEIEELEEPVLVYNFEVEDYHTYYVSELGVLVHNMCCGETGETDLIVDSYKNMSNNENIKGQAHHLSQGAAFNDVIPYEKGLCVELEGNAFKDIGSGHYEAHKYMESFWDQYRPDGALHGTRPTIGQYNRAVYDSLKTAGLTDSNAAYAVKRMYEQQMEYGLKNTKFVPRIPGKINQKKPR